MIQNTSLFDSNVFKTQMNSFNKVVTFYGRHKFDESKITTVFGCGFQTQTKQYKEWSTGSSSGSQCPLKLTNHLNFSCLGSSIAIQLLAIFHQTDSTYPVNDYHL
jgi:hypothetical protein